MLLPILLLNLVLCLTNAESTPKQGLKDLENYVEKLEFRFREMELRSEETEMRMKSEKEKQAKEKKELEARNEEMEIRLKKLADKMKDELRDELEKKERGFEASMSKLRKEVKDSLRSNNSNNALTRPSPRDLPIVFICAWWSSFITSPQTVTFESFLANYNNNALLVKAH